MSSFEQFQLAPGLLQQYFYILCGKSPSQEENLHSRKRKTLSCLCPGRRPPLRLDRGGCRGLCLQEKHLAAWQDCRRNVHGVRETVVALRKIDEDEVALDMVDPYVTAPGTHARQ